MAPGILEFCSAAKHSPSLPGRHIPPVPLIPILPAAAPCFQHTPVTGSEIVPPGQGAPLATGVAIIGAESTAPPQIAASTRRWTVDRIVMVFSVRESVWAVRTGE